MLRTSNVDGLLPSSPTNYDEGQLAIPSPCLTILGELRSRQLHPGGLFPLLPAQATPGPTPTCLFPVDIMSLLITASEPQSMYRVPYCVGCLCVCLE